MSKLPILCLTAAFSIAGIVAASHAEIAGTPRGRVTSKPGFPASPTPVPASTPTRAAEAGPSAGVEQELDRLRERLATLESTLSGVARAASPTAVAPTAVAPVMAPEDIGELGPALALAGVGLLLGFVIGVVYGQRQERNRRSRVRF